MEIEMVVKGLIVDPVNNMPVVILSNIEGTKVLPIWIGVFEANAISLKLERIETPRPMTHDLVKNLLTSLDVKVNKVVVCDIKENTFYALIYLEKDGEIIKIDSRPSDAIALALRIDSPIYVEESVLTKAHTTEMEWLDDKEKLQKWLEKLKPEDFGKYKM
ncbi:MAG: bifunctional nuclease family protein [Candidatus Aminicenantia bacterium]